MDPRTTSPGLAELGRRVGASERTLSRLFRDEVGMGCTVWRNQLRLHLATLMLPGGRTVTQTASTCGYSSASTFVTTFPRGLRADARVAGPVGGGKRDVEDGHPEWPRGSRALPCRIKAQHPGLFQFPKSSLGSALLVSGVVATVIGDVRNRSEEQIASAALRLRVQELLGAAGSGSFGGFSVRDRVYPIDGLVREIEA